MNQTPAHRRRPSARPLADMINDVISPTLAAKGFAGREVIGNWSGIVGSRLADHSRPLKIDWPRQRGHDGDKAEPATLVVMVESAFAPELQHAAPVLMARINSHLGWPAVGRLVLKQGPVHSQDLERHTPDRPLSEATVATISDSAARITEPALKDAVTRLGLAVSRKAAR